MIEIIEGDIATAETDIIAIPMTTGGTSPFRARLEEELSTLKSYYRHNTTYFRPGSIRMMSVGPACPRYVFHLIINEEPDVEKVFTSLESDARFFRVQSMAIPELPYPQFWELLLDLDIPQILVYTGGTNADPQPSAV